MEQIFLDMFKQLSLWDIIGLFCIALVVAVAIWAFIQLWVSLKISKDSSVYTNILKRYKQRIGTIVPDKTIERACDYFNVEQYIVESKVNSRHLKAATNTLVGLGIFGTFLGLSCAFGQNITFDEEHITESIYSLLGGMKTAFYSSVAGMFASIIYGFFYRKQITKLQKQIDIWCVELDNQYFITPMELMVRQTNAIELLGNNIGSSISSEITNQMSSTMRELIGTITESLKEQMVQAGEALKYCAEEMNDAAEMVKQSTTDFNQSTKNMRNLMGEIEDVVKRVGYTSNAIAKCQSKYDETIALLESLTTKFKDEVVTTFSTIESSVSAMGTQLEQSMSHAAEQFQTTMESTMGEIGDATNQFQGTILATDEMLKTFDASIQKINQTTAATEQMINSIYITTDTQSKTTNEIQQHIWNLSNLQDTIERGQQQSYESVMHAIQTLTANIAEIPNIEPDIEKIFDSINAGINQHVEILRAQTGDLISEYTKQFTASCESINGTTAQLIASVEQSTTQMIDSVQKSAKWIDDAATKLSKKPE